MVHSLLRGNKQIREVLLKRGLTRSDSRRNPASLEPRPRSCLRVRSTRESVREARGFLVESGTVGLFPSLLRGRAQQTRFVRVPQHLHEELRFARRSPDDPQGSVCFATNRHIFGRFRCYNKNKISSSLQLQRRYSKLPKTTRI